MVALLELAAGEVADAEAVATGLVHVGRTDALQGRADFSFAFRLFRCCVEQSVGGRDEVGAAADVEIGPRVHTGFEELGDFALEDDRIDDDAIADDVLGAFAEHAARDGMKDVLLAVKNQRVPGVGSALEARDDVVLRGQDIHDFPFSFVAPLEAQKHINLHVNRSFSKVQIWAILRGFPTPCEGMWKKVTARAFSARKHSGCGA